MLQGREDPLHDDMAQCYSISSKTERDSYGAKITHIVLVCYRMVNMLFNKLSTYY